MTGSKLPDKFGDCRFLKEGFALWSETKMMIFTVKCWENNFETRGGSDRRI